MSTIERRWTAAALAIVVMGIAAGASCDSVESRRRGAAHDGAEDRGYCDAYCEAVGLPLVQVRGPGAHAKCCVCGGER